MKRVVLGSVAVAAAALWGETVGDRRLQVEFDESTGWVSAYRVDGAKVLSADPGFRYAWLPDTGNPSKMAENGLPLESVGKVERLDGRSYRSRVRSGNWEIGLCVRLLPEKRMVRHWFELTWRGTGVGRIDQMWLALGALDAGESGEFLFPAKFPPRTFRKPDFKPGRTQMAHESCSPTIAVGDGGWGVLAAIGELAPYADHGNTFVTERADAISLSAWCHVSGYVRSGATETTGDVYLQFFRGLTADGILERMHEWHRESGLVPPADRAKGMCDLVLYSTDPRGTGELREKDAGGLRAAAEDLPMIRALGANAVWLRPLESEYAYAPDDYYRLADNVGTDDDLKAYVARAHGLGLKVWRDAVMHGGKSTCRRAVEHPEWLAWTADGKPGAFGSFDYYAPGWVRYFADYIRWATKEFDLDGWRMDVPGGSWHPNWNTNLPYRASFACNQGGLAQQRAIRAAMRAANPRGATLGEVNYCEFGATCDSIYDQFLAHGHFRRFCNGDAAGLVRDLMRYLHEQQCSFPPGIVLMRYPESHDTLRALDVYGRAAANAFMAVSAWIPGFPLVYNEGEDGAFETFRRIFALRAALPELREGRADYSVSAPDGVFAVLRETGTTAAVALVNFNAHRVAGRVSCRAGTFEIALPSFGFTVRRLKGAAVAGLLPDEVRRPYVPERTYGGFALKAELRDLTNGVVRAAYRIADETADGVRRFRVVDFGGLDPKDVQLVVRVPDVERWFAHSAEGTAESPLVVRHPGIDVAHGWHYCHPMNGAIRWDSRRNPFGFTREHATVGACRGGTAFSFSGFHPYADVKIWDRLLDEKGFAIAVSGAVGETFALEMREEPVREALRPRAPGTGDERFRLALGGWLWEEGGLRVRLRKNGAIVGIWTRDADGTWRPRAAAGDYRYHTRNPPSVGGMAAVDSQENRQDYAFDVYSRIVRHADGGIRFLVESSFLRPFGRNSGPFKMIWYTSDYEFASGESFRLKSGFGFDGRFGENDGTMQYRLDRRGPGVTFGAPRFTGSDPRIEDGPEALAYVYHDDATGDLRSEGRMRFFETEVSVK